MSGPANHSKLWFFGCALAVIGLLFLAAGGIAGYYFFMRQPVVINDPDELIRELQTAYNTDNTKRFSDILPKSTTSGAKIQEAVAGIVRSAAAQGHVPFLRLIHDRGYSMALANEYGQTPIHIAAYHKANPAVFTFFVTDCHLDVEKADSVLGETPLLIAAKQGDIAAITTLISLKARFDAKNNADQNALHLAAENNQLDALKKIIQLVPQLEVNAKDNRARTALHIAVEEGNLAIVECLVHQAVDLRIQDKNGKTVVDVARELPSAKAELILKVLGASRAGPPG